MANNHHQQWWQRIRHAAGVLRQTGYLMVGVPDYDNYVRCQRRHNPHAPVMNQRQFLDYCQKKRLEGKGGSRCC